MLKPKFHLKPPANAAAWAVLAARATDSLSPKSDPWAGRFPLPCPTQVGRGTLVSGSPQCCWNCGHCNDPWCWHSQTRVRRSDGHGACRLQVRGQSPCFGRQAPPVDPSGALLFSPGTKAAPVPADQAVQAPQPQAGPTAVEAAALGQGT